MELDREDPREPYPEEEYHCPVCGLLLDVCDCPNNAAEKSDFFASEDEEGSDND